MKNIEYYINIIKNEEDWNPISINLINEILEYNKLYGFTLEKDDLKYILDSLKNKLYYKKVKLVKEDIDKLVKEDKEIYNKFKKINDKLKKEYNIPFSILDFVDYKNELIYIIKYS